MLGLLSSPMRRWTPLLALLVACASGSEATRTATASGSSSSSAGGPTLYDRLGRRPGIDSVVHTFVGNIGRDKRINVRFMFVDMDVLQAHLTDQICAASGAPAPTPGAP